MGIRKLRTTTGIVLMSIVSITIMTTQQVQGFSNTNTTMAPPPLTSQLQQSPTLPQSTPTRIQTGNTTNSAVDFYRNLSDCSVLGDLVLETQCNRVKADQLKESLGPGILVENPENLTVDDIPANITGENREIVETFCTYTPHTCAADIERYTPRPPIEYEDNGDEDEDEDEEDQDNEDNQD